MADARTLQVTIVVDNDVSGARSFVLCPSGKDIIRIGRGSHCDLSLENRAVSTEHIELRLTQSSVLELGVIDLSNNGTSLQCPNSAAQRLTKGMETVAFDGALLRVPFKVKGDLKQVCLSVRLSDGQAKAPGEDVGNVAPGKDLAQPLAPSAGFPSHAECTKVCDAASGKAEVPRPTLDASVQNVLTSVNIHTGDDTSSTSCSPCRKSDDATSPRSTNSRRSSSSSRKRSSSRRRGKRSASRQKVRHRTTAPKMRKAQSASRKRSRSAARHRSLSRSRGRRFGIRSRTRGGKDRSTRRKREIGRCDRRNLAKSRRAGSPKERKSRSRSSRTRRDKNRSQHSGGGKGPARRRSAISASKEKLRDSSKKRDRRSRGHSRSKSLRRRRRSSPQSSSRERMSKVSARVTESRTEIVQKLPEEKTPALESTTVNEDVQNSGHGKKQAADETALGNTFEKLNSSGHRQTRPNKQSIDSSAAAFALAAAALSGVRAPAVNPSHGPTRTDEPNSVAPDESVCGALEANGIVDSKDDDTGGASRAAASVPEGPIVLLPVVSEMGPPPERFSDELWEQPRNTMDFELLGDACKSNMWTYVLRDEKRRSFAAVRPCPFKKKEPKKLFDLVYAGVDWNQPMGANGPIPRKTGWLVTPGCTCRYRYGSIEVEPQEFPPWMVEVMQATMPFCGIRGRENWPTSCNVNLYEDGGMSVGWHADDEQLFQGKFQDIRIISLSLGAKRQFELRANWPAFGEKTSYSMSLGNGDLCTMEGMTQKHFQHRVPKDQKSRGPRINLTWRWILKHTPRCPVTRRHSGIILRGQG